MVVVVVAAAAHPTRIIRDNAAADETCDADDESLLKGSNRLMFVTIGILSFAVHVQRLRTEVCAIVPREAGAPPAP